VPVFVGLDFDVHFVGEDAGQQVVVELLLHGIGVPGVQDELPNSRNRGSGNKERLAIGLEDLADVVFDPGQDFGFVGGGKALAVCVLRGTAMATQWP
jgi:hypothetical protein